MDNHDLPIQTAPNEPKVGERGWCFHWDPAHFYVNLNCKSFGWLGVLTVNHPTMSLF